MLNMHTLEHENTFTQTSIHTYTIHTKTHTKKITNIHTYEQTHIYKHTGIHVHAYTYTWKHTHLFV